MYSILASQHFPYDRTRGLSFLSNEGFTKHPHPNVLGLQLPPALVCYDGGEGRECSTRMMVVVCAEGIS